MSTGTKFKALYTLLFLLWAAYLIVNGISVSGASPSDAAKATSYLLGGVIVAALALLGSVSTSRAMRDGGVVNEFDGLIPLVNEEGSAIGFRPTDDLEAVPGHPIADAWWKEAGANAGSWTSGPQLQGIPPRWWSTASVRQFVLASSKRVDGSRQQGRSDYQGSGP